MLTFRGALIGFLLGCLALAALLAANGSGWIDIDFRLRTNRALFGLPLVTMVCLPLIGSVWAEIFRRLFAPRRRYRKAEEDAPPPAGPPDSAGAAEPNWAELEPNLREREALLTDLARQVRLLLHAGRGRDEVLDWLRANTVLSEEAARALLDTCEHDPGLEIRYEVRSGPWDFGGVLAPREDPIARLRERREQPRRQDQPEPDPTFDTAGASYARLLAGEARRGGGIGVFTLIAFAAVLLPLVLIAAFIALSALR